MYKDSLYKNLLVIGGNVAGLAAASQARRVSSDLKITVLESGKFISYGTCALPYYISGIVKNIDDIFAYPVSFFEQKRKIKILIDHKVVGIDLFKKELLVNINSSSENKIFSYDKLIVCSGALPVQHNIPGINAKNVFHLRNVEDALNLKKYIGFNNPSKAVVMGGGSIGLLTTEALNKLGIKVTIVEKTNKIFRDFEDEISTILHKKAKLDGIEIHTGCSVTSINQDRADKAFSVSLSAENGNITVDTDLVIVSTGIIANTEFLSDTSIELGINKAIKVTSKLQSSQLNVYAAGNCATVKNIITGKDDYIPTANNAAKMGRIAGENAAGGDLVFPGSVGTKTDKVFGLETAKVGLNLKDALELGYNTFKISGSYYSHASAVPGAETITITIIVDASSRKLLGAQMIGKEGIGKRIDIFASAITSEMKIDDIYMLDLSYAPPVSTVWDPVNKICGKAILELKKKRFLSTYYMPHPTCLYLLAHRL